MRQALILVLLLIGLATIRPLGHNAPGSSALLTFGFLILAAHTVGQIAGSFRLPKMVGYLIAGLVFGPSGLATLDADGIARLSSVSQLAVALIAFLAGSELQWSELRGRGSGYLRIIVAEMPLTFCVVVGAVLLMRAHIPIIAHREFAAAIVFALLLAAILIAHSPAATFAVLKETRARGPVARSTLGVILLSDIVLIVVFSLAVAAARLIIPPPGELHGLSAVSVLWEIGGAIVVGAAIGGAVSVYLRFTRRELLLLGIIIALFGAEIARITHVELLLTLLTAGFITENFTPAGGGEALRHAVERVAAPVFVVFFALAGASIHVGEVYALLLFVGPIVLLRGGAMWLGAFIGTRWARFEHVEQKNLWKGLISQSGVAIGLATIVASAYPQLGTVVQSFALAVIAVNELMGPVLFRRALSQAGEIVQNGSIITRSQHAPHSVA